MRLTTIDLPRRFYGLVFGVYCIGLLGKLSFRSRPKFVATRLLTGKYRTYGVMTGTRFYGMSNLPKYTFDSVRDTLVDMVKAGQATVADVLKYESEREISTALYQRVELVLEGKLALSVPAAWDVSITEKAKADITSTAMPSKDYAPSASTLKSIQNMARLRDAGRYDRKESRRLATIQYNQSLIEILRTELQSRESLLEKLQADQVRVTTSQQLSFPPAFLAEGEIPNSAERKTVEAVSPRTGSAS